MRIHFLNRGHAERCLKNCRLILETELSSHGNDRLPARALRNVLCQGLGYSSYQELESFLSLHTASDLTQDSNVLLEALIKSFRLSLKLAQDGGFRLGGDVEHLAVQLGQKALRALSSTDPNAGDDSYAPPDVPLYRCTIEGRKFFVAFSIDGPYVSDGEDGVAIGVSSIVELPTPQRLPQLMN